MKNILLKLLKPIVVELVKEEMEKQSASIAKDVMKMQSHQCCPNHVLLNREEFAARLGLNAAQMKDGCEVASQKLIEELKKAIDANSPSSQ